MLGARSACWSRQYLFMPAPSQQKSTKHTPARLTVITISTVKSSHQIHSTHRRHDSQQRITAKTVTPLTIITNSHDSSHNHDIHHGASSHFSSASKRALAPGTIFGRGHKQAHDAGRYLLVNIPRQIFCFYEISGGAAAVRGRFSAPELKNMSARFPSKGNHAWQPFSAPELKKYVCPLSKQELRCSSKSNICKYKQAGLAAVHRGEAPLTGSVQIT
jgi:hypothetical protein